jgi:hypothetical protein
VNESVTAVSYRDSSVPTVEDVAFEINSNSKSITLRAPSAFFKKKWLEVLQDAIRKARFARDPSVLSISDASCKLVSISSDDDVSVARDLGFESCFRLLT